MVCAILIEGIIRNMQLTFLKFGPVVHEMSFNDIFSLENFILRCGGSFVWHGGTIFAMLVKGHHWERSCEINLNFD